MVSGIRQDCAGVVQEAVELGLDSCCVGLVVDTGSRRVNQPRVQQAGAVTLIRVAAPPSSNAVQQAIDPLMYVRPWGR